MSDEMFRVLELPHEIDPDNMTATIKNEVLEVSLAKVNPGKKIAVGVKSCLGIGGWEWEMSLPTTLPPC